MKDIGEKLKEARENIGVSIDEVAEDLKLSSSQIENIENGNIEAFQDVFNLKYLIRDYAKYLGLDKNEMIDEFNEYLFDYTSQISLEDIKKARNKDDSVKKEKKVISPYTMEPKKKNKIIPRIIWCLIIILVIIGGYFTYKTIADNNRAESNVLG